MKAPRNFRVHIGLFGRRNTGKSSLLNAVAQQTVSIVSAMPGTTTDPVEKPMELLPIGPVLFMDTAGLDDMGDVGLMRVERSKKALDRTDLALLVVVGDEWGMCEETLLKEVRARQIPCILTFAKTDVARPGPAVLNAARRHSLPLVLTSSISGAGLLDLKQAMFQALPDDLINRPGIVYDLVESGACVVLVVPVDKEAPKGRLILPQVQTIRDALDNRAVCVVTQPEELKGVLAMMNRPPSLVVTDSQAFASVAENTPETIPLTSFSILFARRQGDLDEMVRGAMAIANLKPGDRVLIAEACSHHPIEEDIGTVKIPRWLEKTIGGKLNVEWTRGHDFPDALSRYRLVIHCGACMWNRKAMLNRIWRCRRSGVPITNYGLTIAYTSGIFERALRPFQSTYAVYLKNTE